MKTLTTECGIQFQVQSFEVGQPIVTSSDHKPMLTGNFVLSDQTEAGIPFKVANGKIINITLLK